MIDLILLGGGGHCESVIEVIRGLPEYRIKGILDPSYDPNEVKSVLDFPILGNDGEIDNYVSKGYQFVITVGQIKSSNVREKLYNIVLEKGGKLPVIVANTAQISNTSQIGEGSVIMHNAFLNAKTKLGACCIANTGCIIEHGCSIGGFCHISTGAILNGEVICGNGTFIGSGTIVNQGVTIGKKTVIGSGSLVRNGIGDETIFAGNPIKRLK